MRVEFSETSAGPAVRAAPQGIVTAPGRAPPLEFDLPPLLLKALVGTSAAYLLVMGLVFRGGAGLGLIFAIFAVALVGYYGLPLAMARAGGHVAAARRRGAWGIDTASGYLPGGAAWAQIMTVPLLMLGWALLMAVIL
jgi:uncharacterized membrane protein